jgi:hypothetical protein
MLDARARKPQALSCYTFSMKAPKRRRAGATQTFSVSVDPLTKRALRQLADSDYGGNLSALITDFAHEARRRLAAGRALKLLGVRPMTDAELDAFEAQIAAEISAARKRRRSHRVA